ncbi:YadA-like family protein [Aggregatibacter actinomycetemcomitans]|nr:YadA-like family protein [Aggregatibacter actinomycetemcomitans]
MNKVFRVVWHQATQSWIAVSELSRQKSKTSSETDRRTDIAKQGALTSMALLVMGAAVPGTLLAAPLTAADVKPDNQHFISVAATHSDTDISQESNYNNNMAKAPGSIAIGTGASVAFEDRGGVGYGAREAIAIGQNATVKLVGEVCADCTPEDPASEGSISIGRDSVSGGRGATSIGLGAKSEAHGVSIGINATTSFSSVAIGVDTQATKKNAVAVGNQAKAEGLYSIAIGLGSNALSSSDLAVGDGAKASGGQGSAFGIKANASASGSTSIGGETSSTGWLSTSVGYLSKSANTGAFAGGARANASGSGAVSIGMNSTSTSTNTTAVGAFANAAGPHSTAMGVNASTASGAWYSLATGSSAKASSNYAMANGHAANASAEAAVALGANTTSTQINAVALGANASATHINAVALGANSVTKAAVASNEATVNGVYYGGFAANQSGSVVSVGETGRERQLVNVAAGQISATSTDAINGSQLYLVASGLRDQMPVVYTTASGKKAVKKPDGKFYEVDDAGNVTSTVVPNADVIASMNDGSSNVTSPMTLANIKSTLPDTFSSTTNPKDGSAVALTTAQAMPTLTASQYNHAATLGDVLNAGWNLQAGGSAVDFVKPYDTVNFKSSDNSVEITPSTDGSVSTIDLKVKTAAPVETTDLTVTNGAVVVPTGTDAGKLVNATTVANTVNNAGWSIGGNNTAAAGDLVKPSNKVNFVNGSGTESVVNHDTTTGSTTVAFNVKPNGTTINVTNDGISVNTGNITAAQTTGNDAGKVTVENAEKAKVATVENVANAINSVYWKVGDNDGTVKGNIGAGSQMNFVNGNGTTAVVKHENGVTNVTFDVDYDNKTIVKDSDGKLSVNVSALPAVNIGNSDGSVTVTKNGNAYDVTVNTTQLTNSADGKVNEPTNNDGSKLVNATTLANIINNSGWSATATANGGEVEGTATTLVKPGSTVNYIAGNNIKLKQDGSDFTISTTDKLTAHEVEVGQDGQNGVNGIVGVKGKNSASVTVKGEDGSIALVGPKGADGSNGATITITPEKGTTTIADKDGGNPIERIKYTDGSANVREVATLDDGLTFTGDDGEKVNRTLGANLNIKGGATDSTTANNIRVVNDGANGLKVNLANNVKLDNTGSVTVGDTTLNNNGLTIANGPSVTADGINAGNKTITNVAPGVNPTDAVNVSQLGGLKNDIQNVNNRIGKVNREARAGIAGANAAASLPQAYIPGKSMVAAAGGTFKGQNAFAVGYSRSSDNGKVILKLQGNANTQGDVGGGVGVGYQW